jgi:hypothetical protein
VHQEDVWARCGQVRLGVDQIKHLGAPLLEILEPSTGEQHGYRTVRQIL